MPSNDNLLEHAFMARIRADEYREALAALQQEFDERPDVIEIKRRIERCEEERRQCIAQAQAEGVTKQGSFRLKIRTRKNPHGDPGAVLHPIRRGDVRPVLHCRNRQS